MALFKSKIGKGGRGPEIVPVEPVDDQRRAKKILAQFLCANTPAEHLRDQKRLLQEILSLVNEDARLSLDQEATLADLITRLVPNNPGLVEAVAVAAWINSC